MTLKDIESWGGSLQLNGGPGDERRMKAIREGTIDAIFDEGLVLWFNAALDSGMQPVTLDDFAFKYLVDDLGWRKYTIKPGRYKSLKTEHTCIDYSGWPIYTRAALPDDDAYKICDAIAARKEQISGKILTPASASSAKTPTPRRATSRSIQARRNGTASTGLRCRNSQFVRTNR